MSKKGLRTEVEIGSPASFFDRELSWLEFARRVLAQVEDEELVLLERVKFAGIVGMLHDEFFMKRMSGLERRVASGSHKTSMDGRTPREHRAACRDVISRQLAALAGTIEGALRPALAREGVGVIGRKEWSPSQAVALREVFERSVLPVLTPLAVDPEHPFPFISNDALNLAILVPVAGGGERFVRLKVPDNRSRWVPLPDGGGCAPLEEVIAANLDLMFPDREPLTVHFFRVTRAAEGDRDRASELEVRQRPGSIVLQVRTELKARRFAGVVRLEVDASMPDRMTTWLSGQLDLDAERVYRSLTLLRPSDLLRLPASDRPDLRQTAHEPAPHPRLRACSPAEPEGVFAEIGRGDILLHHPYDDFDTSVLTFLEAAAVDPAVLAIKLTIYRTARESPIVAALSEAARRGKQVAVLVEITARFDEAPNIAWGKYLEAEGVHVAYGVEKLKTHVKLALVVREEAGVLRRYAHIGTGNYHTGTARIYEDLGLLTADPALCEDVALVFNQLTGATSPSSFSRLLVAPATMRPRFLELVDREAEHARAGRPAGIRAKMNQLQDRQMIEALYRASAAGVPIELNVRGLCCLRPGVPGLSETIRVFGVVDRFLEHSRVYRFENAGEPEYFIGSADWMKRNLSNRVETVAPVSDPGCRRELDEIFDVYTRDNCSVWDGRPDGSYERRRPAPGEARSCAQERFMARMRSDAG